MDGLPSHLFVVRHGNRLDAADKRWHLSSPAPYDPPLTYGGLLQARQVGNQIVSILEQLKLDHEHASSQQTLRTRRRKRFKVVIHSSPFLRCVQTSIGISSGLAQTSPDSMHHPSDIIVPIGASNGSMKNLKSAIVRLDSYLGEWLSPEYFENITPPPGSALMLGAAKAELLKRQDYSRYTDPVPLLAPVNRKNSLWSSPIMSPSIGTPSPMSEHGGILGFPLEEPKGYAPPKPTFAVSSSREIPHGFVAHAKDACVMVDYRWDSMRAPLEFGDGGLLGEEWTTMHRRFRRGLRKMMNWYATASSPAEPVTTPSTTILSDPLESAMEQEEAEEDIETVVIIVSHGAGCNALIGAITHQPVLMDIGIASITMATRKPGLDYLTLRNLSKMANPIQPLVQVDKMYDIRISATTEHLHRGSNSTPVSGRSSANPWTAGGNRGRMPSFGSVPPVINQLAVADPFSSNGSRSSSAGAALGNSAKREPAPVRPSVTVLGWATSHSSGVPGSGGRHSPPGSAANGGLWTPSPSSLRLVDDGRNDGDADNVHDVPPNFDQRQFQANKAVDQVGPVGSVTSAPGLSALDAETLPGTEPAPLRAQLFNDAKRQRRTEAQGPLLASSIKLHTSVEPRKMAERVNVTQLGEGMGGLWGQPTQPGEAERLRDLTQSKRRWTVNARTGLSP